MAVYKILDALFNLDFYRVGTMDLTFLIIVMMQPHLGSQ